MCCRCSKLFNVKLPYWNTTPIVQPNWSLTPCSFIVLNARLHRMLLNLFAPISIRVMPHHFLVSDKSPFLYWHNLAFMPLTKIIFFQPVLVEEVKNLSYVVIVERFEVIGGTWFSTSFLFFVNFFLLPLFHPMIWVDQFLALRLFVLLHLVQTSELGYRRKRLYQSVVLVPRNSPPPLLQCFHWVAASSLWWDFCGGLSCHQIKF